MKLEKIPQSAIIWLTITAIGLILIPIIYFLIWKKKGTLKAASLFAGILGFLISARVLEMIPHIFCIILDNPVSRFINGNVIFYMLYGALMAGIFEECGRYIVFRYILKKSTIRDTAITYGIGHGGFEVYIISFAAIMNYLTIALMINLMGVEPALQKLGVTDATRSTFEALINSFASYSAASAALTIGERILVVSIHIALSIIVFYGVKINKIKYLFIAIAAHAILDAPAALAQKGAVPTWLVELWLVICLVALVFYSRKLYVKMKEAPLEAI